MSRTSTPLASPVANPTSAQRDVFAPRRAQVNPPTIIGSLAWLQGKTGSWAIIIRHLPAVHTWRTQNNRKEVARLRRTRGIVLWLRLGDYVRRQPEYVRRSSDPVCSGRKLFFKGM